MKLFRNITKQAFILIVSEVFFVGLLSFGINRYLFSFMETWSWWQYSLLVIGLLTLAAVTLLAWELISTILKKRGE